MKSLRILICSKLIFLIIGPAVSFAQLPLVRVGIYEFTGATANEFYILAPTVMFGYDVWKKSRLVLHTSTGFSFNQIKYNDHRHYLYMIPCMTTVYYNLPNPDEKVWPGFGMGVSLIGKADHNKDFAKTHYSVAFGYNVTGRLNFAVKGNRLLVLEMTYNLMIPPVLEEVDISGVILTVGLIFPSKKIDR